MALTAAHGSLPSWLLIPLMMMTLLATAAPGAAQPAATQPATPGAPGVGVQPNRVIVEEPTPISKVLHEEKC